MSTDRLSHAMLRALYGLARYGDLAHGIYGRGPSAWAGLEGTRLALQRRGLIEPNPDWDHRDESSSPWRLTDAGREAAPEERP